MFHIKFIVKEAPNYSKECWIPVRWVDQQETLTNYEKKTRIYLTFKTSEFRALAALQYIPTVEEFILSLRKELKIPLEGYGHQTYFESARRHLTENPRGGKWNQDFPPRFRKVLFQKSAKLPFFFKAFTHTGYTNLGLLVLYGVLEPVRASDLIVDSVLRSKGEFQPVYQGIFLGIQTQISMTKLVSEIKRLYKANEDSFERLPSYDFPTVSWNAYQGIVRHARKESYVDIAEDLKAGEDVIRIQATKALSEVEKFFFGKIWKKGQKLHKRKKINR